MNTTDIDVVNSVKSWFEKSVLGLNLCPFAAKPHQEGSISFELSKANSDESCLTDILLMLKKLEQQTDIETMVLIIPDHLQNFDDYNQFLSLVDELLIQQNWEGVFQVASFHPDYVFADTDVNDQSNWTNRSPCPLLHLIRESSINEVVKHNSDLDKIPLRNIEVMRSLSAQQMKDIFG